MTNYTITFHIRQQRITAADHRIPVSDTREYLRARFVFDDEWLSLASCMGVFIGLRTGMNVSSGKGAQAVYSVRLDANGECLFPAEVLTGEHGTLLVGAIGYSADGKARLTTNTCAIRQEASCFRAHGTPNPPAPDLYAEMMRTAASARAIAERLTADAEAGVFDGKDGTPGKDGKTPYISIDGNWCIGATDTGVRAEGRDGMDGIFPYHELNNVATAHSLPANRMSRLHLIGSAAFSLEAGRENYDNEWGLSISVGTVPYPLTMPATQWTTGIAPTFSVNTTTVCRLYYVGSTLCGEWVTA